MSPLRLSGACLACALALGLVACEPPLALGGACAYTTQCPPDLVCVLGRCRAECLSYRDCDPGSTCLADETTGLAACRVADESSGCASDADCGALVCEQGHCVQRCTRTSECRDLVCVDGTGSRVCVEPTGATCTSASECGWGVCEGSRCTAILAVAAGESNTCVLSESGELWCAGDNDSEQISGDRTLTFSPSFVRLAGELGSAPPFESLDIGTNHVCALADGEVRCWGNGAFGQTGGPGGWTPPFPGPIVGLRGVRELALGYDVSCARTDLDVVCWGSDRFGLLGDLDENPAASGDPSRSRPAPIDVGGPWQDVDAGFFHACAVSGDFEVWCWGANDFGNCGVPVDGTTCASSLVTTAIDCVPVPRHVESVGGGVGFAIAQVTVGLHHTCVRGVSGAVRCWGANDFGQLGDGTAAGPGVYALGGIVVEGAVDVQAGAQFTCALLEDGRIACWGGDAEAQLGDGGGAPRTTPVYVPEIDDARAIAIGPQHGCALRASGELWCWGRDVVGQLGTGVPGDLGTRTDVRFPIRVVAGE